MPPAQLEFHPILAMLYGAAICISMTATAFFISRIPFVAKIVTPAQGRYGCLDGFRGLLAIGVFIHHSFTAYVYFTTGRWVWCTSHLFNQLGQTPVALFFMITGFLFAQKASAPKLNWKQLYISRFARLFPLYAIIVFIVLAIVLSLSKGVLYESPAILAQEVMSWLAFVCFGRPNINAYPMTWTIIAGVNWSLDYEIQFYVFGIPLLYFLSRFLSSAQMLKLSAALLAGFFTAVLVKGSMYGFPLRIMQFLCGIFSAYIYAQPRLLIIIRHTTFRLIAAASAMLLLYFENAHGFLPILLSLVLFLGVAGGLSGWGFLQSRPALWLGDISYGMYLIHGLILWLTLSALKKYNLLAGIDLLQYSLIILICGGIVTAIASISFAFVERPALKFFKKLTQ